MRKEVPNERTSTFKVSSTIHHKPGRRSPATGRTGEAAASHAGGYAVARACGTDAGILRTRNPQAGRALRQSARPDQRRRAAPVLPVHDEYSEVVAGNEHDCHLRD